MVRQFKNEYNPVHFHDGFVSAVGYLKVPKNLTSSKKKVKTNGTIDFISGTKTSLSNSIHNHTPKKGDMIFFPADFTHGAKKTSSWFVKKKVLVLGLRKD